jgi:hypothetical protein
VHLDLGVLAVAGLDLGDPLVGAVQPAREVVTHVQLDLRRRLAPEVGVERDDPLDLVERALHVARELLERLAREPAVLALDRRQGRDQTRPGELPVARLRAGDAHLDAHAHVPVADVAVAGAHHAPSLAVADSCSGDWPPSIPPVRSTSRRRT